ncbi:TetR/AcrR family transcriptional regulator [Streptomyces millisiae]|uniref:Helix-turn-helix domain-containing protein n=1 Tax=Streptomyces millisiae TaxID=3075542 RepID=A0ABU2LYA0_9ACTN|nr:helix-turn-helix domain-containing protein [Streptomyces sp. DSM 44918]MDT0322567.1 helix-turn-helix domain-containing protein [Streptomyces sp. DSM 44918]
MPENPAAPSRRRQRADARRNRERLLTEADAAFREHGTEASLEQVARRAGVAIGTLYSHFPTRDALLEALFRERHEAIMALGDELLADPRTEPDAALARWMRAVTDHTATYRGLAGRFLGSLEDETSELYAACKRMAATGEALTERARAAGAIRADATANDVFALISAAAWLREQVGPADADRLATFLVDGLRA